MDSWMFEPGLTRLGFGQVEVDGDGWPKIAINIF